MQAVDLIVSHIFSSQVHPSSPHTRAVRMHAVDMGVDAGVGVGMDVGVEVGAPNHTHTHTRVPRA